METTTTAKVVTRATVNGRTYEVVRDPAKVNEPMGCYIEVYRIRKDGTRGRRLYTDHKAAWAAICETR